MPGTEARLDGVFITPLESLSWTQRQWREAMATIAAAGMDMVILQYISASGRAVHQSARAAAMPGMAVQDLVVAALEAAKRENIGVVLGLDATRSLADIHYSPVQAQAFRSAQALVGLLGALAQSSAQDVVMGFYFPQEWSAPPTPAEAALIAECAAFCRNLLASAQVVTTAPPPRLPVWGHGWELSPFDPQAEQEESSLIEEWAQCWRDIVLHAHLDALLLRDDSAALRWTAAGTLMPFRALWPRLLDTNCELWAQVGLYDLAHRRTDRDPPRHHSSPISALRRRLDTADEICERRLGYSFEYMNPALGGERAQLYDAYRQLVGCTAPAPAPGEPEVQPRPERSDPAPDPLLEKAAAVERHIDARHLLEGQIMTVVDYQYPTDHPRNQWQEDADFLTGLYCGAECMRFAATGDPEAKARARRAFEALHMLSTVSGVPGVVARCFRRQLEGDLGRGRKRWVKVEGQDLWWGADISRDQLSGHFFGLACYYDLVADDSERREIRRLIRDIVGSLLDNRMQAVDYDGEYTIHGNFWVAPFQALATLKLAHHITGARRFQDAYREYISPHFFLGWAQVQAAALLDPFYQHYQFDSPAYHLLQYETDRNLLQQLLRALDLLHDDVKDLGNVYHYFIYQLYRPESDAARRGEQELLEFQPDHLYRAHWKRAIAPVLAGDEDMPDPVREALAAAVEGGDLLDLAPFIPMWLREPMEFNWQYYAGIQTMGRAGGTSPGGEHAGYAGVDYLLAYWMGRYHGFLR